MVPTEANEISEAIDWMLDCVEWLYLKATSSSIRNEMNIAVCKTGKKHLGHEDPPTLSYIPHPS